MNLSVRIFQLIVFLMIGGCAAMPAKQSLGIGGTNKTPERPVEGVSMIFPGSVSEVDGYKIPIPPEWQDREVVCRIFENLEGKEVSACRKASRVFINDVKYSAFIWNGNWYVFVPKGIEFSVAIFPPAEGDEGEGK